MKKKIISFFLFLEINRYKVNCFGVKLLVRLTSWWCQVGSSGGGSVGVMFLL